MADVRLFRTLDDLQQISGAWDPLLSQSLHDHIFLTWEWQSAWAEHFLNGRDLFVIAVFDETELVAIAPLWLDGRGGSGLVPTRTLKFLGSGEACSDYLDLIVSSRNPEAWVRLIWDELFGALRTHWDVFQYSDVAADSQVLSSLYRLADLDSRCWVRLAGELTVCPYLPLPESFATFSDGLSHNRRYILNPSRKRLANSGPLRFTFPESDEAVITDLRRLKELNTRSWQERNQPGSFATEHFVRFHDAVATRFLKSGRLFFRSLWAGDQYLGGLYGFCYRGVLSYYIMSVVKSDQKRVNTGDVLLAHCIEEAIRRNCHEFDFLRGDESYKYRWAGDVRRNVSMWLYNRTWRAFAHLYYDWLKTGLRNLLRFLTGGRSTVPAGVRGEAGEKSDTADSQEIPG